MIIKEVITVPSYIRCPNCGEDLEDWREAFRGCKHCGHEHFLVKDPNARGVMRALLDEIDELRSRVEDLENNDGLIPISERR
jgi:predicted  nucleic acid-binding Zn-ribbon protein